MTPTRLGFSLAASLLLINSAFAEDVATHKRSIRREPAYKTKPQYCLLEFGDRHLMRVWLVLDGDELYVDRNGNGDLTEAGKRVHGELDGSGIRLFNVGDIHDGVLTHKDLTVYQMHQAQPAGKPGTVSTTIWTIGVRAEKAKDDSRPLPQWIRCSAGRDRNGLLAFATRSQDAPVIRFGGKLTLNVLGEGTHLTVGRGSNLTIGVGTPGNGPGTFAFIGYADTIPSRVYPLAEVTFAMPGGKQLVERFPLKGRC